MFRSRAHGALEAGYLTVRASTQRYGVLLGLAAGLWLPFPERGQCALNQTSGTWKATRLEWQSEFIRSAGSFRAAHGESAHRDNTGFFPRAYAPGKESVVAGSVGVDTAEGLDTELWLAERSGRNARRLTTEAHRLIAWVEWAADGQKLAYVTEPVRAHDRDLDARLLVTDSHNGHRLLIAEGGALSPRWSSNSRALFFWTRDDRLWKPCRAASETERPPLEPVAALALSRPGVFSPDAQRVAGLEGNRLLVETLATRQRLAIPLPTSLLPEAVEWSPDSEWLYLRGTYGGIIRPTVSYAVRLSDSKIVALDTSLGILAPPGEGERILVTTANWLPEGGHRLLLRAHRQIALSDRPAPSNKAFVPEHRWLVFDVVSGATTAVTGLEDHPSAGSFSNPVIRWDSDGTSVLIGDQQYHFSAPP